MGAVPPTVAYPLPLVPLLAFFMAGNHESFNLLKIIAFTSLFFNSINLWNHLNDAEDDLKSGKTEAKTLLDHQNLTLCVILLSYLGSLLLIWFYGNFQIAVLFIICFLTTWLYSDKKIVGRIIPRLKEHYIGELFTYFIVTPVFPSILWLMASSEFSLRGVGFVVITATYYLSGMLLKDLKDISSDLQSGYKTLGVVFSPQSLLKASISLNFVAHTFIVVFVFLKIFEIWFIAGALTITLLFKVVSELKMVDWQISIKTADIIKKYVITSPLSITLLVLASLWRYTILSLLY
ncbi:UbiA family prenyltransferase [Archaeoglobus sp.]